MLRTNFSKPRSQWRRIGKVACAGVLAIPACAMGQELGIATSAPQLRVHSSSPAAQPSNHNPVAGGASEAEARAIFERAHDELRTGRDVDGQRRLEALIARYPDSPYAEAARAKVVELYTAPVRSSPRSSLGVAPVAKPVSSFAPISGGAWQIDVRRSPRVAEEFSTKVGDRVFFALGSAELGGRARDVLKAQANWLKRNTDIAITIEGHADDPGSAADNRALAERRSEAVRRRLVEEGVAAERIAVMTFGSDRRIALCDEPVCGAQNRRVVSVLNDVGARPLAAVAGGDRDADVPVGLPR